MGVAGVGACEFPLYERDEIIMPLSVTSKWYTHDIVHIPSAPIAQALLLVRPIRLDLLVVDPTERIQRSDKVHPSGGALLLYQTFAYIIAGHSKRASGQQTAGLGVTPHETFG